MCIPLFITGKVNKGINPKVAEESIAYIIPENLFIYKEVCSFPVGFLCVYKRIIIIIILVAETLKNRWQVVAKFYLFVVRKEGKLKKVALIWSKSGTFQGKKWHFFESNVSKKKLGDPNQKSPKEKSNIKVIIFRIS